MLDQGAGDGRFWRCWGGGDEMGRRGQLARRACPVQRIIQRTAYSTAYSTCRGVLRPGLYEIQCRVVLFPQTGHKLICVPSVQQRPNQDSGTRREGASCSVHCHTARRRPASQAAMPFLPLPCGLAAGWRPVAPFPPAPSIAALAKAAACRAPWARVRARDGGPSTAIPGANAALPRALLWPQAGAGNSVSGALPACHERVDRLAIGQDWTGLDRIGQDWTGLDRIGQDWTGGLWSRPGPLGLKSPVRRCPSLSIQETVGHSRPVAASRRPRRPRRPLRR